MSRTILVVVVDARLRNRLCSFLEREGYDAHALPGGAALRANFNIGILILTGKGEPVDRILGLEMGATDYFAKPFNLRELLARVRSIARRIAAENANLATSKAGEIEGEILAFDGYRLDIAGRRLIGQDGSEVFPTGAEFKLSVALAGSAGRALSRDRLLGAVGGRSRQSNDRSIDLHVGHLRKKLEEDPKRPSAIKTIRGAGYVFARPVERG